MNEYPKKIVTHCMEDPLDAKAELYRCPACESDDTDKIHHAPTFAWPEYWFYHCNECEHEWGWV